MTEFNLSEKAIKSNWSIENKAIEILKVEDVKEFIKKLMKKRYERTCVICGDKKRCDDIILKSDLLKLAGDKLI